MTVLSLSARRALPVALAALAAHLAAQVSNPDFEAEPARRDEIPAGWLLPGPSRHAGYTASTTTASPAGGKRCGVVSRVPGNAPAEGFGNLMQSFPAAEYRGKRVRLRASVRVAAAAREDRAQLWLRVDRAGGKPGFFDNMGDRPITAARWAEYEIAGEVARDAETINVGLLLRGGGSAYLDGVRFEATGDIGAGDEPARPLSARGLDNLAAAARLFGIVRHFHPSDQAAAANWNDLAIELVRAAEPAADAPALAAALQSFFAAIAPSLRVHPADGPSPAPVDPVAGVDTTSLELTAWRHFGLGTGSVGPPPGSLYSSRRERRFAPGAQPPEGSADPRQPYVLDAGGIRALVPLAVFVDAGGTLPRPPAESSPPRPVDRAPGFRPSGNDRATRLAAVVIAWNVFQHFFPYFDVISVDWPGVLTASLKAAAEDRDEQAFHDTLARLVAALQDGHGNVIGPGSSGGAQLPLDWDWIEERLVVTAVAPEVALKRGDVVSTLDGRRAAAALSAAETLISAATTQSRRWKALQALRSGEAGTRIVLGVERDGAASEVVVERVAVQPPVNEPRPEHLTEVKPGIIYVDLDRLDDAQLKSSAPRLAAATGIIFDLRGYPGRLSPNFLGHLTATPVESPRWNVPLIRRPDREGIEWKPSGWTLQPQSPRFPDKIAFITDGRAISYAETCLGIVERYKLGAIVGGPTAGTNGNINAFSVPGGYRVIWTGMKVLKHDGSRHHGLGILPTVPASRTLAGVKDGRDELLDRAVEVLGR